MRPAKLILVVDADEAQLSVRVFLLETWKYRVLSAASSREALEVLEVLECFAPGQLDLLIADLLLAGMDGNELARRAKDMLPGLPVLLTSRTVSNFDRALAADAFLPADEWRATELLDKVRTLVARKRGPKRQVDAVAVAVARQAVLARRVG